MAHAIVLRQRLVAVIIAVLIVAEMSAGPMGAIALRARLAAALPGLVHAAAAALNAYLAPVWFQICAGVIWELMIAEEYALVRLISAPSMRKECKDLVI
jgi:hypothetical protein